MSTQWVNTQPDAGALHALLASIAERIGVDAVDQLWIFPTRRIAVGESTVVVFSLFDDDADRRRVTTARFTVSRDKKGVAKVQDRIDEHGSAPVDSVERVVEGVLRRLGEEVEQPPRNERVDRSREAWDDLLLDLGAPPAPPPGALSELPPVDPAEG
jgi:phenylpropionate dioxygenase-like ring-hydroxylating dioxygenase large terminal subunit